MIGAVEVERISTIVVGIDVGVTGYAVMLEDAKPSFYPIPVLEVGGDRKRYNRTAIIQLVQEWVQLGVQMVVIERPQVFPKMGSLSSFSKGSGYEIFMTSLAMVGIPVEELPPSAWKRELGIALGGDRKTIKARSIAKAQALYPTVDLRPLEAKPKSYKPDDNKAEALLLADMAMRLVKRGARA